MAAQRIRVRQAVDSDARGIAHVHVDSWRSTYAGIVPAEHLAGLDYGAREANWHRILADRRQNAFVAEDRDGRVVGFSSGGPERSGDTAYPAELYAIYLFQSHQRRGLGRRLTAALADWFLNRGWQSMLLWVLRGQSVPRLLRGARRRAGQAGDDLHRRRRAGRDRLRLVRHLASRDRPLTLPDSPCRQGSGHYPANRRPSFSGQGSVG